MAGVFSLSQLEGGLEGPIVGWLIDKVGARRILFIGVAMAGIGFIALRRVNSVLSLYLIFGLLLSLGDNIGYSNATQAVIAKWFIKKRGRALSFLLSANGIGGAIFIPLIAWLILQFGWRSAAVILGVATLVIPLPLSYLIKNTPEEMGLLPDGQPLTEKDATTGVATAPEEVNFSVREALKTSTFWVYAAAMTLRACILSAIVVHQIPHLTDIGIPYQTASNVLGLMVLMIVLSGILFLLIRYPSPPPRYAQQSPS